MSNFERDEIVASIEAWGSGLQGDAMAMAAVLRAIADRLPVPSEGSDIPRYHLYEDSIGGRGMADGEVSGYLAWQWLRDELLRLEDKLKHTMEFYI